MASSQNILWCCLHLFHLSFIIARYIFWSDWTPERPSVNRANMDGSNIKRLFKGTKVVWPNGVTIDYIAERVYWVDAREDYIASCNLDGDNVVKVITDNVRNLL